MKNKVNQDLKASIRRNIRNTRNSTSKAEAKSAESSLTIHLFSNRTVNQARSIACYLSFDGEISTQSVINQIITTGKNCYLPKLRPLKPNRLWFLPYVPNSTIMVNNGFGIPEVDLPVNHAIAISKIEVVLLPLVAFDLCGNRLGMGGGFYDATFAHLRDSKKRPKFIGLAYESQKVAEIPKDPWDIVLDGVCTEQRFYDFEDRPSPQPSPRGS